MKKKAEPLSGKAYIAVYTLLFAAVSCLIFSPFIFSSRSLVNKTDGMTQYLVYLRYMGTYLRSCFQRILSGSFSFPAYDFSIGLGDDIGQIVRFHPLDFLSAAVPSRYTEQLYAVILFLRMYLSGLSFSLFAFYISGRIGSDHCFAEGELRRGRAGISGVNILSGAVVYVFGGYMLLRVVNHPTYAAPFIVFPVLLMGAERVMRREGMMLFPAAVFVGFWSNYYFMYIMSWGLLVYVLVRFFQIYSEDRVRAFFSLALRMLLLYVLGLCMSAATLLPTLLRYTGSVRTSSALKGADVLLYSDKRRYFAWFLNLITPYQSSGNGMNLNFAVTVFPCLAVLFFLPRKEHRALKLFAAAALIALVIPGVGYVLAVFNRENSRWMFLIAMCLGMCVAVCTDHLSHMAGKTMTAVFALCAVYIAGASAAYILSGRSVYAAIAIVQLTACMAVILIAGKRGVRMMRLCILIVTCFSAALNGFIAFSPSFGGAVNDYYYAGKTLSKYQRNWRSRAAAGINDSSFYRIEAFGVKHLMDNCAQFSDFNGTSEYNSIINASVIDGMKLENNKDMNAITTMHGMDARPVMLNLAHVKYFVARENGFGAVPYGFSEDTALSRTKTKVYVNRNPLSFAFSYDSFITRENFEKLEPLQREMIQLHAAVVDDRDPSDRDTSSALKEAGLHEITSYDNEIISEDAVMHGFDNAKYDDGVLKITQQEGSFSIDAPEREGYDCYICLDSIEADRAISSVRVETGTVSSKFWMRNDTELYNMGRDDYLVHVGYSDRSAERPVRIVFRHKGSYRLSGIRVLYVPMDGFDQAIESLNKGSWKDEIISDGDISGTLTLTKPELVVFSVPYADGWTLTDNGKKTKITRGDVMYISALLGEGVHSIRLTYRTPGGGAGLIIAAFAFAVWIVLAAACSHMNRKRG